MRRALIWLVVVALLSAGAVFADSWLRGYVQDQAEPQIGTQLGAGEDLEVTLGGVPFSLALLTRSVPSATLTADEVKLDVAGKELRLRQASITTGRVSLADTQVDATNLVGAAELSYADLEKLAGVPVQYADDGRLELRYTASLLGRELGLAVSALPVLDEARAKIQLTDPKLDLNGSEVDLPIEQGLIDSLVEPIDVKLDYGLAVTALSPAESGLSVAFGGDAVSIPLGE